MECFRSLTDSSGSLWGQASPPDWVAQAVVYQIFPDRFRRSGRVDAQRNLALQPWGTDPSEQGFQGGDLYGVIDALDHLQRLGVTCLYLTPIFCSAVNPAGEAGPSCIAPPAWMGFNSGLTHSPSLDVT